MKATQYSLTKGVVEHPNLFAIWLLVNLITALIVVIPVFILLLEYQAAHAVWVQALGWLAVANGICSIVMLPMLWRDMEYVKTQARVYRRVMTPEEERKFIRTFNGMDDVMNDMREFWTETNKTFERKD